MLPFVDLSPTRDQEYFSDGIAEIDPAWDPIRKDPRFLALLDKYPAPTPQSAAAMLSASSMPGLAHDD